MTVGAMMLFANQKPDAEPLRGEVVKTIKAIDAALEGLPREHQRRVLKIFLIGLDAVEEFQHIRVEASPHRGRCPG